jgi:hypothetical protein
MRNEWGMTMSSFDILKGVNSCMHLLNLQAVLRKDLFEPFCFLPAWLVIDFDAYIIECI